MKKEFVRILSCFIPVKKWRKNFRKIFTTDNNHYQKKQCLVEDSNNKNPDISRKLKFIAEQFEQFFRSQKLPFSPDDLKKDSFLDNLSEEEVDRTITGIYRQKSYENVIEKIKENVYRGKKVRVAFFVIYDSTFPARSIFEKMLQDDFFAPFIVVIPDVFRGKDNMFTQLEKTYKNLSSCYDCVEMSYDYTKKIFCDISEKFDLFCTANPYDSMTHKFYTIEYLSSLGRLGFYLNYGFITSNWSFSLHKDKEYTYLWKYFLENDFLAQGFQKNSLLKGLNSVVTGYAKMDDFSNYTEKKRLRKKIILAPHHTVEYWENGLNMSNFLNYADFFLSLPKRYPDIDFVFRPHPLLFINLAKDTLWGKDKVDKYIKDICSYSNVEYQNGGSYFDTFVNSDALIHDCCSFLGEYLFSGHPCCFMKKDEKTNLKNCNDFALACIDKHYVASNEQDILNFIEEVVIGEKDDMKQKREAFVNNFLKSNYPHVSAFIVNYIKEELGGKKK